MGRKRGGRDVDGKLQDFIQEKVRQKWTAKQIDDLFQQIKRKEVDRKAFFERMGLPATTPFPEIHTIRRIVHDMVTPDTSGPWNPSDKDTAPGDLRTILDILAWITLDTKGKKTTLTKAEVGWILKIAKAAPSAGSRVIWRLVQRYMLAEAKGESTQPLDTYLALKPWESANRFANYIYTSKQGMITEPQGRTGIDELYEEMMKSGSLESSFDRHTRDDQPLNYDPFEFHLRFRGGSGTRSYEKREAMARIRAWWPWMYHRILEVWEDAAQRQSEAYDEVYEKARRAFEGLVFDDEFDEMNDFSNYLDAIMKQSDWYGKFNRLADSFKDGAKLKMSSDQAMVEFDRIVNAPEEVREGKEPEWFIELKKKAKKSRGKKGAK